MTLARPQPTPAAQAKGLRSAARTLVVAGLLIGIGMPLLFKVMKIEVAPTASGFDLLWLVFIGVMITDFGLAWWFTRRASSIERSLPPA